MGMDRVDDALRATDRLRRAIDRRAFAQVRIKHTKDEQKFLYENQTNIKKEQKAIAGKVQQHDNKIYKLEGEAGVVQAVCNELREDRDERRHERLQKEQEARKAAVGEAKAQERLKTQEQHLDGMMKERDELKHQLAVGDETISKQNKEIGELRAQKATLEIKLEKQEELRATLAAKDKENQDLRDQRAEDEVKARRKSTEAAKVLVDKAETALAAANADKKALEDKLAAARDEIANLTAKGEERDVLRRDRDGLLARNNELLAELAKARAETKDLDGRLVAARRLAAVADAQELATKLKAEIQAKEDALARVTELAESNEALRRALEQQTKLKADLVEARKQPTQVARKVDDGELICSVDAVNLVNTDQAMADAVARKTFRLREELEAQAEAREREKRALATRSSRRP